jgi:DNA-binding CsgD family transcriptional regulator
LVVAEDIYRGVVRSDDEFLAVPYHDLLGHPAGVGAAVRQAGIDRFVGRRAELREISARAAAAAGGQPQTVVIEGVPGIGKTSLLQRALLQLADFQQLHADCALGSAVEQLIRPEPVYLTGSALRPAGGLLAAIRAMLSDSRPVIVAFDDVQCIDADSAAEFCAVLSALRTAPLLTVVVGRDHWQRTSADVQVDDLRRQLFLGTSVTQLRLAELSVAETARLLDGSGPAGTEQAAVGLHAYTGGHPALLSVLLDQGITVPDTAPGDLLSLSHPLVTGMLRAVACLPVASRDLLAAMAVSEERWPLATVASVARVDDPFEALEPLLDLGIVDWFPDEAVTPVSIRYPLYRDVVYRSLPAARREALHNRAASFAVGSRAWAHRVAAAPDAAPEVAAMLKQEAERYYVAGDNQRAGTLLMMSTAATSDAAERERRILQAAHWWLTLRAVDWGPKLEPCLARWPTSAARSLILGLLAESSGRYAEARALLTEADEFARLHGCPPLLQADIGLATALVYADLGNAGAQSDIAERLLTRADMPAAHRSWAEYYAADAAGRLYGGPLAALAKLSAIVPDAAIDAAGGDACLSPGSQSVRLWARGSWRVLAGRLRDGIDDLGRMLRAGDRAAADPVIPMAYAYLAYAHYLLGEWKAAEQAAAHAVAGLDGHGVARSRVPVHAIAACVDASAGHRESAMRHIQSAKNYCAECGPDDYAAFPAIAEATLAQADGNCGWMLTALQPLTCRPGPGDGCLAWWLPLQVEGLIGTGQLDAAEQSLDRLRGLTGASGRLGATAAWLEARLAAASQDAIAARTMFELALARSPAEDDVPLHRARLEHDYGRLLMSGRNRRLAIARLRNAYELYRALGARPLADRCAADLEACGAQERSTTGSRHSGSALLALSPRERKIAYLAAQGLTNQEIAGEIFVTAKTVEYHLANVFAKLGISSRRQLPRHLGEELAS